MPQGQRLEVKSLQRLVFSRNIGDLLTYKACQGAERWTADSPCFWKLTVQCAGVGEAVAVMVSERLVIWISHACIPVCTNWIRQITPNSTGVSGRMTGVQPVAHSKPSQDPLSPWPVSPVPTLLGQPTDSRFLPPVSPALSSFLAVWVLISFAYAPNSAFLALFLPPTK